MAHSHGSKGNGPGRSQSDAHFPLPPLPPEGSQPDRGGAWHSSSTPPNVYGGKYAESSTPGSFDHEPTVEDVRAVVPGSSPPSPHYHSPLGPSQDLEESGDYDIRALAPLRHLLDQDWTDPNVRSRLKSRVAAAEEALSTLPPTTGSAKSWFTNFNDDETLQVPVVEDPNSPPLPDPVAPAPVSKLPAVFAKSQVAVEARKEPVEGPKPEAPPAPAATFPTVSSHRSVVPAASPVADAAFTSPISYARPVPTPGPAPSPPSVPVSFDQEGPPPRPQPAQGKKRRFRPWLLAVGAVAVVAAWSVPESLFAGPPVAASPPIFILSSEPRADIYRGDQRLGETPMVLEAAQVGDGLTLHREGFQTQPFSLDEALTEGKVEKLQVVLPVAPVALDWKGVPQGSSVSWQGKPAELATLSTALPGSYSVKVTAPNRPPVTLSLVVPPPGDEATNKALPVGDQVVALLERQPALSMSLKASKGKAPKLPLKVAVSGKGGGKAFAQSATVDGKAGGKLVLPGPGTYLIKVPASSTHQAFSKTVTVKEGATQKLEIALTPVPAPVKVAAAPSAPPASGAAPAATWSAPEPAYYAPPAPAYQGGGGSGSGSGGGGGGGRIAPPSF